MSDMPHTKARSTPDRESERKEVVYAGNLSELHWDIVSLSINGGVVKPWTAFRVSFAIHD